MNWDYRVLNIVPTQDGNVRVDTPDGPRGKALTPVLFAEGQQGWELVQLWTNPITDKTAIIFKRPQRQVGVARGDAEA
jgi:hypothetical protein